MAPPPAAGGDAIVSTRPIPEEEQARTYCRISQYVLPGTSACYQKNKNMYCINVRLGICRSPPVTELMGKTTCSPPRHKTAEN